MGDPSAARSGDAPIVLLSLSGLALLLIVANLETRRMDARVVAVLGLLVALNASLRLVSGPLGASAVFFLPIVCGYVLGADFGFLLGALSILASAFLTGGVGPWLPFQMMALGWCGMISGWLPHLERPRLAWGMLAAWGATSGILFGALVNLWFWPYLDAGSPGLAWHADLGISDGLLRYTAFYLATSVWWDLGRAIGNATLLLALGPPVLRLLERFRQRFRFRFEV